MLAALAPGTEPDHREGAQHDGAAAHLDADGAGQATQSEAITFSQEKSGSARSNLTRRSQKQSEAIPLRTWTPMRLGRREKSSYVMPSASTMGAVICSEIASPMSMTVIITA